MDLKHAKRIKSLKETDKMIKNSDYLLNKTVASIEKTDYYPEDEPIEIPDWIISNRNRYGIIEVQPMDTISAAISAIYSGDKNTTILNFASSLFPGGRVLQGSSAQEESICRCTNLYHVLNTKENHERYYDPNLEKINELIGPIDHAEDAFMRTLNACAGTSSIIYSPNIRIIKRTDNYGDHMETLLPVHVITCAAPDLNYLFDYTDRAYISRIARSDWYKAIMKERCERILKVAIKKNTGTLILGAFGCGAFLNDPIVVATIFKELMAEYRQYFDYITFPIPNENSTNFKTFKNILGG